MTLNWNFNNLGSYTNPNKIPHILTYFEYFEFYIDYEFSFNNVKLAYIYPTFSIFLGLKL